MERKHKLALANILSWALITAPIGYCGTKILYESRQTVNDTRAITLSNVQVDENTDGTYQLQGQADDLEIAMTLHNSTKPYVNENNETTVFVPTYDNNVDPTQFELRNGATSAKRLVDYENKTNLFTNITVVLICGFLYGLLRTPFVALGLLLYAFTDYWYTRDYGKVSTPLLNKFIDGVPNKAYEKVRTIGYRTMFDKPTDIIYVNDKTGKIQSDKGVIMLTNADIRSHTYLIEKNQRT